MIRTSSGSVLRAHTAWIGLLPENPSTRQLGPRGSSPYSSMISFCVRASSSSTTVILSAWRSLSACFETSYFPARTRFRIALLSTSRKKYSIGSHRLFKADQPAPEKIRLKGNNFTRGTHPPLALNREGTYKRRLEAVN